MKIIIYFVVVLSLFTKGYAVLDDRPRIKCNSGHLHLEGGDGKNITLLTKGRGAVVVNGVDVANSLSLVWSVRGQLESLNNTNLGYLVTNLSRAAQTVASQTWISTSITSLNTTVSSNSRGVVQLRTDVSQLRTKLGPIAVNVTRLSSLASLATPEGAQRVQTLLSRMEQIQTSSADDLQRIEDLSNRIVPELRQRIASVQGQVATFPELEDRVSSLEVLWNQTQSGDVESQLSSSFMRSYRRLKRSVSRLKSDLRRNECESAPCQHGGTCIDGYKKYTCLCPKGWEGQDCSVDFNECYDYAGTDLGCQNGATCSNTQGSFQCTCAPGWYGIHCTERNANCSSGSGTSLCGQHGICIPSARGQHTFSCICDEGWKSGDVSPACVDVDECTASQPRCSHDPPVQCVNYPGSFSCGSCPQGYSGNGFYCSDINECLFNNGGCSPFSICENTRGSRRCGSCASGYTGDGVTCMPIPNPCLNNPCHPLARCNYNPQMSYSYQCICPPGYQGNGIGFSGCVPSGGQGTGGGGGSQIQPTNWCLNSPCQNAGTCTQYPGSYTYTCTCVAGYTGRNCEFDIDECASRPCMNGGTCTQGLNSYTCSCTSAYTGTQCQTENQQCGGRLIGTSGRVAYPGIQGQSYNHNISCAWVISVPRSKVINVTFTSFHLEGGGCRYDWLQIHDGGSSLSQLHGRYCGTRQLPGTNGTIISTHNHLYLWFRSDHSYAGDGFNFTWNATDPVCGGAISRRDYGSFNSPGYPGRYPSNRDCYWTIRVRPGKRIMFHFATLQMEPHTNCSFDFLEIRDGLTESGHVLQKFCETQAPAPITTSGSEAFVHFHSDASVTNTGFHISFSAEPGIPGCGGLLTDDEGEFGPPTLSDRYQHNLYCEWEIRVPRGESITLNFTEFHLERHSRCRFDYVEIRDGGNADSPIIRRACGLDLPDPIQSSANKLFVIFRSDYSISRPGFRAHYKVACGGEYTGDTGIIRTPYHPQHYPHNRECIYIIQQPVGKAIRLNFTQFDIERPSFWRGCIFDYVEIRDGRRATSPLLGRFCGPESHRPQPVLSTLNYMWIKFKTDSSITNRGFIANYTTIDTTCGGVLRDLSGHINSPNSPDTYPGNTDCRWVLDLPTGYVIQITWHTFALERHYNCDYDYVEIFDNSSIPGNGGRMGDRFCGNTVPPIMTSSDNLVTIHFHSDHSMNHDGFSAVYHGLDASRMCGGNYHTQSGVLMSPNYPNGYPSSRTCEWTINAPLAHQIRLIFEDVQIETSQNCVYDYLEIRNGGTANSPLMTKICSRNQTVPEMFSHHHQLYIKFQSDDSVSYNGFRISWDSATTGCGGTMTTVSGEIISPGYPQPYNHMADCYWTIRVGRGSIVMLHFIDVDLEDDANCNFDFVEVRDGSSALAPSLGRYCTMSHGFISINSTSNSLWLRFRSDFSYSGRGFKAQYVTGCNNVIRGYRGVIVTPNYPEPYPHNRNCTWTIKAPRGNSINASFSDFVIEEHMNSDNTMCLYDYVDVKSRQQVGSAVTTIGHYCQRSPPPIATEARMDILEISFVSDYSVAENGFRLEWIINGCGAELTKPSGTFTSPNYPNSYQVNTDCEWFIRTAPGTKIEITIEDFDLESAEDCRYDSLKIYGGEDDTSPLLSSLCHKQRRPSTVTTQGNNAFLAFHSDQTVKGKGFNVSYTTLPGGCGGIFSAHEGIIHSPNYPNNYDAHSDCVWIISVDAQHVVELKFIDFDVEPHTNCSYDFVSVYDGNTTESPEMLTHCGDTLPTPSSIKSSGNTLTIRLKADGSFGAKGFTANYTTGCGATVHVNLDGMGELMSPQYPNYYTPKLYCAWHLEAPEGSRILLHIVHLDINLLSPMAENCTRDYVSLKDGAMNDSPEIGRYCGHRAPRSISSSGHHMTVIIIKDYGFGVGFRATYSVLTSACGGDLTSKAGELASPEYPQPYPTSIECTWTIHAGSGNRLQLNFEEFDLQESDGCNVDYLEVHQKDATGELLLHNCTSAPSRVPASITTRDQLWIKFKSGDSNAGAKGFLASYNIIFGDDLYGTSGEVTSPMYPHIFHSPDDVLWTITVPRRKYVSIRIIEMMIEMNPMNDECYTTLVIFDGSSTTSGTPLATLCGNSLPDNLIVSTRRSVTLRFRTMSFFKGSRFRLSYTAVDRRGTPGVTPIRQDVNNCTFQIRLNSSYTFQNPGYPSYANNLNCEWIIETDPHMRIFAYFRYNLEESYSCSYDRLLVYDGMEGTMNWNKTRTLCRRNQRNENRFISSGRFLRIRFVTDSSYTRTGFIAHLRAVCGGYLHGPEGVILSSNYPENYRNRENCEWIIRVAIGRTITFQFDDFRLMNTSTTCGGDYLLMRNGESMSSPFLGVGRYCGNSIPLIPESSSNVVRVQFVTNSADNDKGFRLRYYEKSAACGGIHRLTSELPRLVINSPNYPNPPHPHTECSWTIMGPEEKSISLHFDHMDITSTVETCPDAFAEVRDGGTILSPLLKRTCGNSLPDTQHTTDNALFVRYLNNRNDPHSGFRAEATIDSCSGTYNADESGIITSPDYPAPYAADTNCTWKIVAPRGHYLTISFLDVDIDNAGDNCSEPEGRVVVREKNATGDVLGKICGSQIEVDPVETASNIAYITFRGSHNPRRHTGFRFMYNKSIEECGGDLVGPTGEFTSPSYPHGYGHRRLCTWNIKVPEGRRVRLEFLDFDVPLSDHDYGSYRYRGCLSYVRIYNGRNGPRLSRSLCGPNLRQRSYNSSMNEMTVVFGTRSHNSGRGFRARWSSDDPYECGGHLTSLPGQIASPGTHLGGYNHSLYCIWTVSNPNPANSSFVVHITDLHIEQRCYDFIMIQGVNAEGEEVSVQKICNDYSRDPIVIPYPTLKISFITDSSVNRTGWNLTYSLSSCGGSLQGPQNNFGSPNYPSNYPDNTHCAWLLTYDEGSQIDLEFTDFKLENSLHHDYVSLLNGRYFNSPLIGSYTGSRQPGHVARSMTNALIVQFHSDDGTNDRGFAAHTAIHTEGCGGTLHGLVGNISSKNFPEDYAANSECTWELRVEQGYHVVFTFVERFDVESTDGCVNDYLQFSHGGQPALDQAVTWTQDAKLCGKQMPSPVLTSGTRTRVLFHANEAIQGQGFKISWNSICGNNYTSESGFITSPGYPARYPAAANCVFRIMAPPESYVKIQFTNFMLEGSRSCRYDYVWISETRGPGDSWRRRRRWGKYCGSGSTIPEVITARGPVAITFKSDMSVQRDGFYLNYTIQSCGGNVTSPGIIDLPTHLFYHNSMNCIWDIKAPEGKVAHLKFDQMILESSFQCQFDSISIYDGLEADDSKLVSRLCGNHTDDLPIIVSNSRNTRIVFRTDSSVTREGFRAAVEFTYACGGNVNISRSGATEVIRSLDVDSDGNYEPFLNCHWLVEGLEDHVIVFNFTRLDLEPRGANDTEPCPYDYIELRDGPSPDSELLGRYCNATSLPAVTSSSNVMFVLFRSDSANQAAGFTARVSNLPHPCGASSFQATNETQALESPGYPNHYPISIRCRWVIIAPEDQNILLSLDDMNMESSTACSKDQLYISEYARTDPSSVDLPINRGSSGQRYSVRIGQHRAYYDYTPHLNHGYCGTTIPHHLVSITNGIELRLRSDESITAPGFRLHYSIASCNRTFNWTSGTIRSTGRSNSCFTRISAPVGHFINIYFVSFYIRNYNSECGDNVMKVYDASEARGEPLLSACGYLNPNPVSSTGNEMFISFTPSSRGSFKISYTTSTQGNGCGGSLFVDKLSRISSPGYPGPAPPALDCIFSISVTPDKHVSFTLYDVDFGNQTNCNETYLELYDVDLNGQSTLYNTICGSDEMAAHLSPSYRIALRYVTGNSTQTGQGWDAWIMPATPHEDTVFSGPPTDDDDDDDEDNSTA